MQSMKRKYTLRFAIGAFISALILIVLLLTLFITYVGGMESIGSVSKRLSDQVDSGIVAKIDHLFDSAEMTGNGTSFTLSSGILSGTEINKGINLVSFMLSQNVNVYSVSVATTDGSEFKAYREYPDKIFVRTDIRNSSNITRSFYHKINEDIVKDSTQVLSIKDAYDPRTRPWFVKAAQSKSSSWTDIYEASSGRHYVYAFTKPVFDKKNKLIAVVAVGLDITGLSHYLSKVNIYSGGKSFIVNDRNEIIAYPGLSSDHIGNRQGLLGGGEGHLLDLYTTNNFPDENLHRAISEYESKHINRFEFVGHDSKAWIGSVEVYPFRGGMDFLFGFYFPKSEIMDGIHKNAMYIVSGSILILFSSLFIGGFFARKISSDLSVLSDDLDRSSRLCFEETNPIKSSISEIDVMYRSIVKMKICLKSFKKYLPLELVRHMNNIGQEASIGGVRQNLTVFFADIENFTEISEVLTPESLLEYLSVYFDGMSHAILTSGGTLDKYIGDAVMAFWGAPVIQSDHATRACHAALACHKFSNEFCRRSLQDGKPVFHTKIGLHTGDVVVGNIGNHQRMNYTIIGDSVNLTSRLEGLNKYYSTNILITESTYDIIKDNFVVRKLDRVAVKGRSKGLFIYELISSFEDQDPNVNSFVCQYEVALNLYLNMSWEQAISAFRLAILLSPARNDYPSEIMIDRCVKYLNTPPNKGWNGVFSFLNK